MLILCTHNLDQDSADRIKAAAPDAEVVVAPEREEAMRLLPQAEVLYLGHGGLDAEMLGKASKLKWIQVSSAGVERYLFPVMRDGDIVLTSSAGVFNTPIAETLLAMMFSFTRRLHLYRDHQREHLWKHAPNVDELEGRTLGIVGLGEIGETLASKVQSLGMRVVAIKRTVPEVPPPGIAWVGSMDALLDLARESDHVVVTLPHTPATKGVLNREVFRAMKPSAYLYNIGRGATIDQEALVEALRAGEIAGAGLDVTTPEPLPPDNPLWEIDNVILTPHFSGSSPRTRDRGLQFFIENLKRYQAGEPLRSVVDKQAGY